MASALNLLLILFIITIICYHTDATDDTSIPRYNSISPHVIPIHYNVTLIPQMGFKNFVFIGHSNIRIKIRHATRRIPLQLHLACFVTIQRAVLVDEDHRTHEPKERIIREMSIVELLFDKTFRRGYYILRIIINGQKTTRQIDGAYNKYYADEENNAVWLAVKPFVIVAARYDLPCYEYSELKPTYNISIKHMRRYAVVSNVAITEHYKDDQDITSLIITPQTSICEVTFAVSNFVPVSGNHVSIWSRPRRQSQVELATNISDEAAQRMVQFTNTSKIMHCIAIPGFPMHHLANTIIIYAEEDIVHDGNVDDNANPIYIKDRKRLIAEIVIHSIVQNWIKNLITPYSSDDKWLIEGLIQFLTINIKNEIFKTRNWKVWDTLATKISMCLDSESETDIFNRHIDDTDTHMEADTRFKMKPLASGESQPRRVKYFKTYNSFELTCSLFQDKGPLILRMLQYMVGRNDFNDVITLFLQSHKFKSVTSNDLWSDVSTVMRNSYVFHKYVFKHNSVKTVMDFWIKQKDQFVVSVSRPSPTIPQTILHIPFDSHQISISLKKLKSGILEIPDPHQKWYTPVTCITQLDLESNTDPYNFDIEWISPTMNFLTLRFDDCFIVNVQRLGYYRVDYQYSNWEKIANYLNSDNYTKIHVNNRVQFIDDAFYFMSIGIYDSEVFCNLTKYLSRTTDYASWYPMFSILSRLKYRQHNMDYACQERLGKDFLLFLQKIEYADDVEDDFIKEKIHDAVQWACAVRFNTVLCKMLALEKLNKTLEDVHYYNSKMSPFWREWTYCIGLRYAHYETWTKVFDIYKQSKDITFLFYLTCTDNSNFLITYLTDIVHTGSLWLEDKTIIPLVCDDIITHHSNHDYLMKHILNNFQDLVDRGCLTPKHLDDMYALADSQERRDRIRKYKEENRIGKV